jgi:hypothetical protein
MIDVFQFMEVRAPYSPEAKALRQSYIYDDFIGRPYDKLGRYDTDLSINSPSDIAKLVYRMIFCTPEVYENEHSYASHLVTTKSHSFPALSQNEARLNYLINEVLNLLHPYQPVCQPVVLSFTRAPRANRGAAAFSETSPRTGDLRKSAE